MTLFAIVLAVIAASMALLGLGQIVAGRRLTNGCARLRGGHCPCADGNASAGGRCARRRRGGEGGAP